MDQLLPGGGQASTGCQDVGDVCHGASTFWRKEAEALLVPGPMPTEAFAPETPLDHPCLDGGLINLCW